MIGTSVATPEEARLRVVFGYSAGSCASYTNAERLSLAYLGELKRAGFDVVPFRLDVGPGVLLYPELDRRWRWGERELLGMYERLEMVLDGATAFINGPGVNLHPRFVERLPVVTAFQCFDDPESTELLSRPVATAYDLCLVGNAAEVETYRSWGVRRAVWMPMGLMPGIYDPSMTENDIRRGARDVDLFMLSDRRSRWRARRMDQLEAAFPGAAFYGPGWARGYLPEEQQLSLMKRCKIGPNLHNSTGPVNFRSFYLPANGILQICDNRTHLSRLYEVGREVVGFDTVAECIDKCRYYLAHPSEGLEIAVAGWRRALRDYTEVAVHRRRLSEIMLCLDVPGTRATSTGWAAARRAATGVRSLAFPVIHFASAVGSKMSRLGERLRGGA